MSPSADSTKQSPKANPPTKPAKAPSIRNDARTRARAVRDLGINVPIMVSRVVGGRLQLKLYGGQVLYWPVPTNLQGPAKAPSKAKATK